MEKFGLQNSHTGEAKRLCHIPQCMGFVVVGLLGFFFVFEGLLNISVDSNFPLDTIKRFLFSCSFCLLAFTEDH